MNTTYEVRIYSILTNKHVKKTTYTVRWKAGSKLCRRTFATKALAESFRSKLIVAQREGLAFDIASGLPEPLARRLDRRSWLTHGIEFVDMKWPNSSAKHRASIADALATITPVFLASENGAPTGEEMRSALYRWAFNKSRRDAGDPPADVARILKWIETNSVDIRDLADAALIRKALDTLSVRLDGKGAAANTIARRRATFYGCLKYAVELRRLESHPFTHVSWTAPKSDEEVDRRTVVNPNQAAALIEASGKIAEDLQAFFGCLYYAALRPEEALHLRRDHYERPTVAGGWGWLQLAGATVAMGSEWSGDENYYHDRQLKHRAKSATRRVPVAPALVVLLDHHIDRYEVSAAGRLFVTHTGANPGRSVSSSTYTRIWRKAREKALTEAQQATPLARVPYQLRHAAVSLWLNAGVPATQVAEWAGHSLHVLLKVYAKCIDGEEEAARRRIDLALNGPAPEAVPGTNDDTNTTQPVRLDGLQRD